MQARDIQESPLRIGKRQAPEAPIAEGRVVRRNPALSVAPDDDHVVIGGVLADPPFDEALEIVCGFDGRAVFAAQGRLGRDGRFHRPPIAPLKNRFVQA